MLLDTDFTFAKKKVKSTRECEGPTTSSASVSLPPMGDELSEKHLTQIAKNKTCTPICYSSLVGPHAWQRFAQSSDTLPPPLQVFFDVKTPGTQLYAIVRTGKGSMPSSITIPLCKSIWRSWHVHSLNPRCGLKFQAGRMTGPWFYIASCACLIFPTQHYRFGVISAILHEVYVSSLVLQVCVHGYQHE